MEFKTIKKIANWGYLIFLTTIFVVGLSWVISDCVGTIYYSEQTETK